MNRILTIFIVLASNALLFSQSPGDTIRVQAFNYDSETRDSVINFPDIPDLTYEKIILKYGMRCKDGLVSTSTQRNLGCGEWDYSCNTYLVDSSKIESQVNFVNSHFITNYNEESFPYVQTPVYDYLRGTQFNTEITTTNNEFLAPIGSGTSPLSNTIKTSSKAAKSQYLYTAEELTVAGLTAGEVDAVNLNLIVGSNEARFLKILMKNTTKTELEGPEMGGFTEVFYNDLQFSEPSTRLQFYQPFVWDGVSNVIIEFNHNNVGVSSIEETLLSGDQTVANLGVASSDKQEIIISNNTYIECDEYKGISGNQNRTLEAWVKTTNGVNGEIISWGTNVTGGKYVWRFVDGRQRVEVTGGGTESSTLINDGEWHHIACVLDGNSVQSVRFYVDGVLDDNQVVGTTAINTNTNGTNVRISRGINNRYLDATIDDVRIWDTVLPEATINTWKNMVIDDSHPNIDNLQLNFQFDGTSKVITDSSDNNNDATIIGQRNSVSELDGASLFKDFEYTGTRPNIIFVQGDYVLDITEQTVDRPIAKPIRHLVSEVVVEESDPTVAMDDVINYMEAVELWLPVESIYDEITGDLIETNTLNPDGEINITELAYNRRFPFYNELVSFVTPYGIGLDLEDGAYWDIDMSDYVSILKGNKRIQMTLGGQFQEDMDLEFLFIVGTPPRDVVQYEQIWQGTNRIGSANINQILADEKFAPASLPLSADASTFLLKSSVTGHGSEGEFAQNGGTVNHFLELGEGALIDWNVTQECSLNPVFPQGGTWVIDRQGWCPGEQTKINEVDITSLVNPGGMLDVDYFTSSPPIPTGDYRYHVAHQLIGYGEANFQNDAALVSIMAPNNSIEFTRVGTICSDPTVIIRNTGAQDLTSLTINYWINDAQKIQTYEWQGNLAFMEEEEVSIPASRELWSDILDDNNRFYVELENPNGASDQYEFNNTMNSSFNFPQLFPNNIQISFRTNNNPIENSYQLYDAAGNLVGSNTLPAGNNTYNDPYSLEGGCYTLSVIDTGGDGVEWWANPNQGSGTVRILNENGISLRTFEPDFGGGFEYSFDTNFTVSAEELAFLTSIEVYPNPTNDFCTIEADDLNKTNIYLTDVLGRSVKSNIIDRTDQVARISVNHLEAGIYFIAIERDGLHTTRRIIVE